MQLKKKKKRNKFQFVVNATNHLPSESISVPKKPDGSQLLFLCKLQSQSSDQAACAGVEQERSQARLSSQLFSAIANILPALGRQSPSACYLLKDHLNL